jgi:hypothetical protein
MRGTSGANEEDAMATHAAGTFQLTSWDENAYEELEGKTKLTRARITQDFTGDLEAKGSWEALMYYRADGTATFVGLARLAGRIGTRSGSFVVQTIGDFDGEVARSTWSVVPGSGTGDLEGLRGEGTSAAPHGPNGTFTLDYDLDGTGA